MSILKKMGPGRLPGGHTSLMKSLPPDWGQFRQRVAARQQQVSQPTAPEAGTSSEAPSRHFSDSLKGKLEKAEQRLRPSVAGTKDASEKAEDRSKPLNGGAKGKLEKAEGPSRSSDASAKGKTKKADGIAKPHDAGVKGKKEKAQGPSRHLNADAKGTSDRPKGLPQASSSDVSGSSQPKKMSSKAGGTRKATKDDLTSRQTDGQTSGQTKDEKAGRAAVCGQKRPAWGAPQPPSKAARVAEARTFKVCTQ